MAISLNENRNQGTAVRIRENEPHLRSSMGSNIQDKPVVANGSEISEFPLNFSPDYVKDWTTTSAFRELYQNWKDAIIESFQLDLRSFRPVYEENEQHTCITVPKDQPSSEALGFIRHDKRTGQVTLANACAKLELEALQLGQTTKRGKGQLVGCHGEGLKLAAMVMSRESYQVSVETNNTHWNFYLQGSSQFHCIVSPCEKAIPRRRPSPGRDMARFTSRIWRDVAIVVGPSPDSCDQGVSREQFRKWLEVSMEIRGYSYPESVIETDCGDLILDPRHRGKMFLKGILLPSSVSEPRGLKLGYNFLEGNVNRDRQRLVSREQEANLLRRIWESAIHKSQDLILPIYVNILWNFPRAPDVELAENLLEKPTRQLIWKHLLRIADGRRFYFCQRTGSLSVGIITSILRKEPVGLPDTLWNLLQGSVSIRTANQQRVHIFRHARITSSPMTLFGATVLRALRASLALCSYPSKTVIVESDSKIQMLVDIERQAIIIDQQSFDISKVHEQVCRPGASLMANGPFLCDHVIEELFAAAQHGISQHYPSVLTYERQRRDMRVIKTMIRLMPRDIALHASTTPSAILVTWEDGETEAFSNRYGHSIMYHIVLHEEKCASLMSHLAHSDPADPRDERAKCGCLQKFTTQNKKGVGFLSPSPDALKRYFPMIAVNRKGWFYGHPPEARSWRELQNIPRPTILLPQLIRADKNVRVDKIPDERAQSLFMAHQLMVRQAMAQQAPNP